MSKLHTEKMITRRRILKAAAAGASSVAVGSVGAKLMASTGATTAKAVASKATVSQVIVKQRCPDSPRIRGPFLILSTPFTDSGKVDFEVLAREARYADWCGSPGMVWPQSGDSVDLLTMDEKLEGMEVLAKTARDLRTTSLCLGVQGKDTDDMLIYAKHVEKLAPPAIISRPPDAGKTQDDMRQYWQSLASVTKRPVIIQTTGGTQCKGPPPSIELLIELAKEFPNFGYVKEEVAGKVIDRIRKLIASPSIRRVFSAHGGFGWLGEAKLGTEGLITERMAYADLLTRIWELMQSDEDPAMLKDAYSKFTLMLNLHSTYSGGCGGLRGFNLHLLKMRGVFRNTLSRYYGPKNSIPEKPIVRDHELAETALDKIRSCFETLKPYQKPGKFDG